MTRWYDDFPELDEVDLEYMAKLTAKNNALWAERHDEASTAPLFWHYCRDCDRSYGSTDRAAGLCDDCRKHYAQAHDELGPLVEIDPIGCDAWIASRDAEYDVESA